VQNSSDLVFYKGQDITGLDTKVTGSKNEARKEEFGDGPSLYSAEQEKGTR